MEIPQEAVGMLKDHASSGNPEAISILTDMGVDRPPVIKDEPQPVETAPAEAAPEAQKAPETPVAQVDEGQPRNGKTRREPTKLDTIRELRRKRRELEGLLDSEREETKKRMQELEAKFESLQKTGFQKSPEDDLTALLEKPGDYLAKREARIMEQVQKMLEKSQTNLPAILQKQSEKAEAGKIINSIDGFDLDENEDDLIDLLEDYGLSEKDVYDLANQKPVQFARLAKKVWAGRNNLPAATVAAKGAASASAATVSKPPVGPKLGIKELNAQFAAANARGDTKEADKIMKEIFG